jgi:3-methyladenine DNA glycosylase AlkD
MATTKRATKRRAAKPPAAEQRELSIDQRVNDLIAALKRHATAKTREGMARYAIPNDNALGVSVGTLQKLAKQAGKSHALALGLWDAGYYEARMLAAFVDEPEHVTPAQMERWCKDFDNWAICDTVCFHLFDRTAHAFDKVERWATRKPELEKRAAFALLASLAGHDKSSDDAVFARCLLLVEQAAEDERNFVKKAVSWALRRIGTRSARLRKQALIVAQRLAQSPQPAARWVGKDALRDLSRSKTAASKRAKR